MTAALLTLAEARVRLNMSERQLRKLVAEQRIECVRDGRWLRFEESAISAYIAGRRVPVLRAVPPHPSVPPDAAHLEELVAKHRLRG